MRQGRGSEETGTVLLPSGKNAVSYRGAYRVPLVHWSVGVCACFCVCVCVAFVVFTDWRELYGAEIHNLGIYGSGRVWANAWDVFRLAPSRGGRGGWAAVDFVVCVFGWAGFFSVFFDFFPSNAHGLLQV